MLTQEADDSMLRLPDTDTIGLLLSGGIDSCILLRCLLERGGRVLPIYVDSGLVWQEVELSCLLRFLASLCEEQIDPLVTLSIPLSDIYKEHWSVTGIDTPSAGSPDEAVYMPGRNAMLLVKAAVYCQSLGIEDLALGVLGTSPFADSKATFFCQFAQAISTALNANLRIHRPFAEATKQEVMKMGRDLPLEWTFSCLSPQQQLHCGQCNKCAERRLAFREVGLEDPTQYAAPSPTTS